MLKSGQEWAGTIVTKKADGSLSAATVGPAGTLYVNGVSNGASVTVTGANPYKWTVTLPALTAGDLVSMYITATIDSVATAEVVAEDVADTKRVSDLNDIAAGALMGLADDAITSAKFDESTAFPVKSADTGSTAIARVGADSDTLETLSDQVDGLVTGGTIAYTGPVATGGAVTTYMGDDYDNADGRALEWESADWPVLTDGTISVKIAGGLTFTGSVVTPTGTKKVRLELTAAQSATIPAGKHRFQIVATVSTDVFTLVADQWTSVARTA